MEEATNPHHWQWYIYVDECQDVSGIQDAIIKSLTGPGHQFFMVGDIKQSIYGFRHAEPDLFEHERRTYSDDANATERRIFFMDNYRSCKGVVDAVNEVFTEAMDERITDMNYIPEDRGGWNREIWAGQLYHKQIACHCRVNVIRVSRIKEKSLKQQET